MDRSFRVEPEKIGIVRNHYAPLRDGKRELTRIISAQQPGLRCGRNVNAAAGAIPLGMCSSR